ncbi:Ecto-ADP-ribosyltransferase 5 [Dissostichus eleginoides]|uniref:NAD(P)(+)--arginine ADP-ribosyltransferase n=1 Tax=Dissostichus eleginoides TaxID=100907 RepID=A0AAD9FHZ5_DISEL|nr:Ecto-ADP-ribosyltransferase 5 [Dissostichus eleginoides]
MAVWRAVLLLHGVSTGIAMNCAKTRLDGVLPLDNAPDSVDDMYDGCKDNMKKKVQTYLQNEKNSDNTFKQAWDEGEKYYQKRGIKKGKRPPKALGKEQATLNAHKPEEERCLKVYRRVNRSFSQDVLNKVIRFGSFTSSSMGRYASAQRFGDKSCFEIITCLGADVSLFSKLGESEREVLIPPYEAFKVTKINTHCNQKDLPCDVVYKLETTNTFLSNLNCALF